ncbi:hypothetical protein WJX74_001359 [Apatococcus lobatus]|uniref:AB hydrolase-1 domain-containing protein n=1 Tax=Apatococcus lobatus TaxID=904363 RepID=A0AAW1QJM8_9CHLO
MLRAGASEGRSRQLFARYHPTWPSFVDRVCPSTRQPAQQQVPLHGHMHVTAAVAGLEQATTEQLPQHARPQDSPDLAHELIQGPLVRFSSHEAGNGKRPPTAVMVHGILGNRRNMHAFAKRLSEVFPAWQVLLVDLRCHGDSSSLHPHGPHGVEAAASDIIRLLTRLRLFPEVLLGHSFGGKVVMSMADQFTRMGRSLPRPVQVWVLDALPGEARAGYEKRQDHPQDLIQHLLRLPMPLTNRSHLQQSLSEGGFSPSIQQWTATNLRPTNGNRRQLNWTFNLNGISEMYEDYEETSLWPFLQNPSPGYRVSFVRAEKSSYKWGGQDEERIRALGHSVFMLRNAGGVQQNTASGTGPILYSSKEWKRSRD